MTHAGPVRALPRTSRTPKHGRAKLLRPTEKGREPLRTISVAQKAWSDAIGAEVGARNLMQASALIGRIQQAGSTHGLPGEWLR
jgi:DNA-binding MarR family transcriptional regulator